jgi:hypothetical protein
MKRKSKPSSNNSAGGDGSARMSTKFAGNGDRLGQMCDSGARGGVVTLSQIERHLPRTANTETWDFNDLACCSID